ncbi:MAG: peptidylprolyl isomerase [Rhodospirillaceae bacterium]|jgi:peptidyl-prolyl cis-trans isomerase SurA|nr:peptidylprolyl isomerase [Rhodospirillaceae bacterium]MBT6090065.1 peptidylprolyl isomerase [Rhodospirillaceae bacterium]MBT6959539.1 peptidylprolyl isomerase [Rhodospirillaceae bacterium]MBT7449698.1 peptidylprolyl isomerase [Rhodospirillaceae bacterium]
MNRLLFNSILKITALMGVGCLLAITNPQPSIAQQDAVRIAAVVNEDVITLFDVQSRIQLFLITSGLEDTVEVRQRLLPQVMNALIEEKLKLQEARREEIETEENEVLSAVQVIEQNNGMPSGAFFNMLAEQGIDSGTFYSQVEADVVWLRVVREILARDISVSEEEVNTVIDRLKANQGKPEYLLGEIFLPLGLGSREADIFGLAQQLAERARSGTPFQALAQQFSQSPTAAVGGDLGWTHSGDVEPELERAILRMKAGETSEPIRTASGYTILALRDQRATAEASPLMAGVALSQIYLPTVGRTALSPDRLNQLTTAIQTQIFSCPQMNDWADEVGGPGSGPVDLIRVGGLPEAIRDTVMALPVGQVSQPVDIAGARLFVMVCDRQEDSGLPSQNQVYSRLESAKLDTVSRQRLRDLRRQALIDVRL